MKKRWWMAAVLLLPVAAWAFTKTPPSRAVVWRLDRRFEWTAAARDANFADLWANARAEYEAKRVEGDYGFYRAEYPAKAKLLAQPDRTLAALSAEMGGADLSGFAADLAISLGQERGRPLLDAYPGRLTQCPYNPALSGALAGLYSQAELQQMVLAQSTEECRRIAWEALPHNTEDPEFLRKLVLAYKDGPLPWFAYYDEPFQATLREMYGQLGRRARIQVIQSAQDLETMERLLKGETDPAVRQELLARMGRFDDLVAAVEQDGAFAENSFWSNWQWERDAAAKHPDSFLARGIRAYEAVRGQPYFQWDRRSQGKDWPDPWEHGNRQYDPAREIPGWEAFLAEFGRHEAAGDAAYRLGRSYEITGQYAQALKWLKAATTLPSSDIAYQARGRIVWLLDALLTEQQLEALRSAAPEFKPAVDYSLAVRRLRASDYAAAVDQLDQVLAAADGPDPLPGGYLPFWPGVKAQREKAASLRALAADTTPAGRYALAAAIYHDELIFYNCLWGGNRAAYFYYAGGHAAQALAGDMDPVYTQWIAEFNNYIQAANAFAALAATPGEVGEKAAYSRAMALLKLTQGYGYDVALWRPVPEIAAEAAALLERFAAERPKSDLADDALLSLGYLRRDRAVFERILNDYPKSDSAPAARAVNLKDLPPSRTVEMIPFRYLTLAEAPPAVATWAGQYLGKTGGGTMQSDGATYIMVATEKQGVLGTIIIRSDYTAQVIWAPGARGTGYVLAKVTTTSVPIRPAW